MSPSPSGSRAGIQSCAQPVFFDDEPFAGGRIIEAGDVAIGLVAALQLSPGGGQPHKLRRLDKNALRIGKFAAPAREPWRGLQRSGIHKRYESEEGRPLWKSGRRVRVTGFPQCSPIRRRYNSHRWRNPRHPALPVDGSTFTRIDGWDGKEYPSEPHSRPTLPNPARALLCGKHMRRHIAVESPCDFNGDRCVVC